MFRNYITQLHNYYNYVYDEDCVSNAEGKIMSYVKNNLLNVEKNLLLKEA